MKQFIVMTAVLPLLMVFTMQYALTQEHSSELITVNSLVYEAKEQARLDGYFTDENCEALLSKLCEATGAERDEIVIEATDSVRYRKNSYDERELIEYKVTVPVKQVMAGASLFGISEDENRGVYVIEGSTLSERLPY